MKGLYLVCFLVGCVYCSEPAGVQGNQTNETVCQMTEEEYLHLQEIKETKALIALYQQRVAEIRSKMEQDAEIQKRDVNATKKNVLMKESDLEYLTNLVEREVIQTPTYSWIKSVEGTDLYLPEYYPEDMGRQVQV